jgi:hypothetical protein
MSERYVRGFISAPDRLWELVGSGLPPDGLLPDASDDLTDLDAHLQDSWPGMTTEQLTREILAGRLGEEFAEEDRSFHIVRTLAVLLESVGEPVDAGPWIWLQTTMAMPWGPTLNTLGLTTLAGRWGTCNFPWPWPPGTRPKTDWPVVTELPADALHTIIAELGEQAATGEPAWRTKLAALPDDALLDDYGHRLDPDEVRRELADGLEQLTRWVTRALDDSSSTRRCVSPRGNSLILITDGDQ